MTEMEVTGTAQREAWAERIDPPVEKLRADLWSIPITLPDNPLRYTTVYALAGEGEVTLIDAGWDSEAGWQQLQDGLAEFGASIADVSGVLVTHQHFDHIGLARRIREATGAWVGLHPADNAIITKPDFREEGLSVTTDIQWLIGLGASSEEAERLRRPGGLDKDAAFVIPDRMIEDGELISASGWTLRAVHTPGHTPGHLAFYDERSDLLFGGDTILPRISPNVSASPHHDNDALGDFLSSLDRLAQQEPDEVLPAHEWRFRGLGARVEQLKAHHDERLAELLGVIGRNPGCVPWDMAAELTWSRPWDQYDGYMRVSAVGETMAHLVRLVRLGLVAASVDPVPRYTVVDRADRTIARSTSVAR